MSPRVLRAVYLFERDDVIAAEAELHTAIAEGDDSAELHALLGLCLLRSELIDRADKEIETALRLEPNLAFAYYALSCVQQARLQFIQIPLIGASPSDGVQARACLHSAKKAVELAPEEVRCLLRLAELHQMLGQWRKSLEPAQRALALRPASVSAAMMCAEALIRLRRSAAARQILVRALEMNPEAFAAHAGMGWALLSAGEHERASQFFANALRINASSGWAQGGALECAKHKYRTYRIAFRFRNWLSNHSPIPRLLLAIALLVLILSAMTALFEWLDKFVRPRLGNEGTALLFTPLGFLLIGAVLFYEPFFTWLVRHHMASKTSVGQDHQRSVTSHFANIFVAGVGGVAFFLLKHHAANWVGMVLGIMPGVCCLWLTFREKSADFKRGLWGAYSGFILLIGFLVAHFYASAISHWDSMWQVLLLCGPLIPIGIASEYCKRRELAKRHDAKLDSLLHKSSE